MIEKRILKAYLGMPEQFRKIMLTDDQIKVVRAVERRGYPTSTSRDISRHLGISVQSASARLKRLAEIGYLNKEQRIDETGGIIYHYSFALQANN